MIKIYIDAATNQKYHLSGGGMIILKNQQQIQIHQGLKAKTNNEAEFEMLYQTLVYIKSQNWCNETIFIYTDSRIVAQSIEKKYVKDVVFDCYLQKILLLMNDFTLLFVEWKPESSNKGADKIAKQALQKTLKEKLIN